MNRIRCVFAVIGILTGIPAGAQPVTDPVADLFTPRPPTPAGAEQTPAVLRPPEPRTGNPQVPPGAARALVFRPPLALKSGDRVLFLGDAVLEAEADFGYLETRMDTHYPNLRLTFRNLSRSPHNRLREADPAPLAADPAWLGPLLEEVRAVQPTVVVVSYGTAAAGLGADRLPAFTNVCGRVLHALRTYNPHRPPHLILLGPLSYAPPENGAFADITNRNATFQLFADAARDLAMSLNADYVDLFAFSRAEVLGGLRAAERGSPRPRFTEDGLRPTAHGLRRLTLALDRGLRWPGNLWRWGLMADGKWRDGGFGARIRTHERRDDSVKVVFTEERLPTPPPPVEIARDETYEGYEPLAYMQVRNLKEGLYELRVDGRTVRTGTHADWHRYCTLQRGPSWDQAEEFRRTVVEKNRAWERWWATQRDRPADAREAPPAEVTELEARLAPLKQPREHTYEIVRVGDAPAGTPSNANIVAP